ncbi:MAG: molybdopterin-dependent oxidoreductase, partial [Acidobacteriota bacterium]
MTVSRRRFLGFTVGATAGTALGVPVSRTLSDLVASMEPPVYPPRGREDFTLSVCALCPGGCGLRVRRVGGRVVKVDGNPMHPVNGGRLCPKGQAALQSLYHPDRVRAPLRRVGPRGSIGSFQRASWDEALGEIGKRLKLLRRERRPESLALMRGYSRGIAARVAARFMKAFGSPNDVRLDPGEEAASLALYHGQGIRAAPAYDLQAAEYVLSLGGALLEAWSSPVYTMRAYGEFRQRRAGRRGKLVQVEPRLSITGAAADEWLRVQPGTEGVLALGVAQVLVTEGLYDQEFVIHRTVGFEDYRDGAGNLREGLRTVLERDYSLERVSAETGVSVNTILRIAREFAASRSPLAVGSRKGPLLPGALLDHLAAQWLNALAGNIDGAGGVLVTEEVPLPSWPALPDDPIAEAGLKSPRLDGAGGEALPLLLSSPEALADAIVSGSPNPVEVLIVQGSDPAFACAAPERFAAALEQVPLVISFASLPDDTALGADWILPAAHFLESWDLDTTPPGVAFPAVSLATPAVETPLHDVRPASQIFLDLARQVGGAVASAFPWKDTIALIRSEVDGLYEARRGAVMGTPFDESWVRLMERAGWWAPGYRSAEELWQTMQERGGWWDPLYDHANWKRVLRTPSGRYEFRTDVLSSLTEKKPPHQAVLTNGSGDRGTEEPMNSLALLLFEPLPVAGGTGAELPFLEEILDPGHEERWQTWIEIHPESARPFGVSDRDWVRVESPAGS